MTGKSNTVDLMRFIDIWASIRRPDDYVAGEITVEYRDQVVRDNELTELTSVTGSFGDSGKIHDGVRTEEIEKTEKTFATNKFGTFKIKDQKNLTIASGVGARSVAISEPQQPADNEYRISIVKNDDANAPPVVTYGRHDIQFSRLYLFKLNNDDFRAKFQEYVTMQIALTCAIGATQVNLDRQINFLDELKLLEVMFSKLAFEGGRDIERVTLKELLEKYKIQGSCEILSSLKNTFKDDGKQSDNYEYSRLPVKFQLLCFKWLIDIRSALDTDKSGDKSSVTRLNGLIAPWLWGGVKWHLLRFCSTAGRSEAVQKIGFWALALFLVIPLLHSATYALPNWGFSRSFLDRMNATYPLVFLLVIGLSCFFIAHWARFSPKSIIDRKYHYRKLDEIKESRAKVLMLNYDVQKLSPFEYGLTPAAAQGLVSVLCTKEYIKSVESVFSRYLDVKDKSIAEYENEKNETAQKLQKLAVAGAAGYVVIEVGQYIQDYRDLLAKQDQKSFMIALREVEEPHKSVLDEKFVKPDLESYAEVIFVFTIVLIVLLFKTFRNK